MDVVWYYPSNRLVRESRQP